MYLKSYVRFLIHFPKPYQRLGDSVRRWCKSTLFHPVAQSRGAPLGAGPFCYVAAAATAAVGARNIKMSFLGRLFCNVMPRPLARGLGRRVSRTDGRPTYKTGTRSFSESPQRSWRSRACSGQRSRRRAREEIVHPTALLKRTG